MAKKTRGKYAATSRYPAARAAAQSSAAPPEEKDKNKRRWLLVILLLLLLILKFVGLYYFSGELGLDSLFNPTPSSGILAPDYEFQTEDPNAKPLPIDPNATKLFASEGGGAINYIFTDSATLSLDTGKIAIRFENPAKSTHDVIIQLVIQDQLVAQSGIIKAGTKLEMLTLQDGMKEKLQKGIYNAKYTFLNYNPETGAKAMVNVESPITLTVI